MVSVRSYGTEDRPTDRPIPPKDEVFEYIIFRGSDIKAIDVVETPKHAANSGMPGGIPADPAIVDFSVSPIFNITVHVVFILSQNSLLEGAFTVKCHVTKILACCFNLKAI